MDRKEITRILLTLFIAVIFIASYASFGNSGSNLSTSSTTSIAPQTVYGSGNANATITGYGPKVSVLISCPTPQATTILNNNVFTILTNLEDPKNNSINNFFAPNQSAYTIFTGSKLNSYQLASYINATVATNASRNCLSYRGLVQYALPSNVSLQVSTQKVVLPIPVNLRSYTLNAKILPINSKVALRVSTLLTYNGTIFGNMSVTTLGGS
ncbi:MAG: hypothetical protein KGH53_03925 [Candidatus Micrarchaeota archaeon]|nr:hypothetical protein [Candidatus Micrarchaeota archaeon]